MLRFVPMTDVMYHTVMSGSCSGTEVTYVTETLSLVEANTLTQLQGWLPSSPIFLNCFLLFFWTLTNERCIHKPLWKLYYCNRGILQVRNTEDPLRASEKH